MTVTMTREIASKHQAIQPGPRLVAPITVGAALRPQGLGPGAAGPKLEAWPRPSRRASGSISAPALQVTALTGCRQAIACNRFWEIKQGRRPYPRCFGSDRPGAPDGALPAPCAAPQHHVTSHAGNRDGIGPGSRRRAVHCKPGAAV